MQQNIWLTIKQHVIEICELARQNDFVRSSIFRIFGAICAFFGTFATSTAQSTCLVILMLSYVY